MSKIVFVEYMICIIIDKFIKEPKSYIRKEIITFTKNDIKVLFFYIL